MNKLETLSRSSEAGHQWATDYDLGAKEMAAIALLGTTTLVVTGVAHAAILGVAIAALYQGHRTYTYRLGFAQKSTALVESFLAEMKKAKSGFSDIAKKYVDKLKSLVQSTPSLAAMHNLKCLKKLRERLQEEEALQPTEDEDGTAALAQLGSSLDKLFEDLELPPEEEGWSLVDDTATAELIEQNNPSRGVSAEIEDATT